MRPLLVRSGGSLPIVPALAEKGIPTVITGFDLPEGNIHSPNERLLPSTCRSASPRRASSSSSYAAL